MFTPGTLGAIAAVIAGVAYWNLSLKHAPAISGIAADGDAEPIEVDGEHFTRDAEDKRLPWLTRVIAYHVPMASSPEAEPEEAAIKVLGPMLNFVDRGLSDAQDNVTLINRPSLKVKRAIWEGSFMAGTFNDCARELGDAG